MGFDIPILVESFLREGILLNLKNIQFIDPLDQWRKNEERKLENAYKYFCDKTIENAHSALYDIEATIEIYKAQKEKYELNETNINSRDFIFLDLNKKIKKIDNDLFFTFGKYKDTSVRNVYKNDKNYLAWMLSENSDFSLDTKMWIKRIIEKLNSIEN
jgi:DNA polymerase-3 subunit epsilon